MRRVLPYVLVGLAASVAMGILVAQGLLVLHRFGSGHPAREECAIREAPREVPIVVEVCKERPPIIRKTYHGLCPGDLLPTPPSESGL